MATYLSQKKFAAYCGVVPSAVIRARREGRAIRTQRGYDPEHPTNKYYYESTRERREARAKKSQTETKSKSKSKSRKKTTPKKNKPTAKKETVTKTEQIHAPEIDLNGSAALTLDKYQADTIKRLEEIKKLQLERYQKRNQLVPRELVQRVLSRLYMIDVNEMRRLGDRIAPEVAAITGTDDPATVIAINKLIEKETFKTLKHIQRTLEDFLHSIKAELNVEEK
jgi:hypothetical protein